MARARPEAARTGRDDPRRDDRRRDHKRGAAEFAAACLMQDGLLPSDAARMAAMAACGLDIAGRSVSCAGLGGDLWGMRPLGEGRLGVYIADFAGHGLEAAFNTVRLHTLLHGLRPVMGEPARLLRELNLPLSELLPAGAFATMFCGVVDPARGRITYAGAGAPFPAIRPGEGRPLARLDSSGVPLGISPDAGYVDREAEFAPGAMLVLYSDLVCEAVDRRGERADEAGAQAMIESCAEAATAAAFVARLCDSMLERYGPRLADDLTVVCVRRA